MSNAGRITKIPKRLSSLKKSSFSTGYKMNTLALPDFQLAEKVKQVYFGQVTMGETVKFPKPVKVKDFSARNFPAITFGDYEGNIDKRQEWIAYVENRFNVVLKKSSRYYMIFQRKNRFSGKFMHVVILSGRHEIYAMRNDFEAKALVKLGHLGRGRASNRVYLSQNPISLQGITFPQWSKGYRVDYPCKIKRLGNMPKEFILWR